MQLSKPLMARLFALIISGNGLDDLKNTVSNAAGALDD